MSRPHLKTFVATFLASVLLYYSAAWAVLRCCHEEKHASVEASVSGYDMDDGHSSQLSWPSHALSQIDCLDFEYHTESLASPAAPPQLHRATAAITPYPNDFFVLKSLPDSYKRNLLRNVFTRGSPLSELSAPPLYLSLSGMRI
jgi:hypothetical protein